MEIKPLEDLLKEHADLLTKLNKEMESKISCTDSEPPDYHDFQTCYEASQALQKLILGGMGINKDQAIKDSLDQHNDKLRGEHE